MNPLKLEAHVRYETHRYQKEREALRLVTQDTGQRRYERRQALQSILTRFIPRRPARNATRNV